MHMAAKAWLIAAASFVVIGGLLFVGVMTAVRWDFQALSTASYETNIHKIPETFDGISIHTDTAAVVFAVSEDGSCRVECHEEAKAKHAVSVADGTLVIQVENRKQWQDYIGFHFGSSPKITVYLPDTYYASLLISGSTGDVEIPGDFRFQNAAISLDTGNTDFYASASEGVSIQTTTGDIRVAQLSAGTLALSVSTGSVTVSQATCTGDVSVRVSTGKAYLTNVACQSLQSTGSTGSISLERVIAQGQISIERNTGGVSFQGCDAGEIFVKTSTGSVWGSLLTEKVFLVETSTGRISVPKTTKGGICRIITGTGNVDITIG